MKSLLALLGLTMLASLSLCAGADVWVTVQKAAEGASTDGKVTITLHEGVRLRALGMRQDKVLVVRNGMRLIVDADKTNIREALKKGRKEAKDKQEEDNRERRRRQYAAHIINLPADTELAEGPNSRMLGIGDDGTVVGTYRGKGRVIRVFLWGEGRLLACEDDLNTAAYAINREGLAIGETSRRGGQNIFIRNHRVQFFRDVSGWEAGMSSGMATSINNDNEVLFSYGTIVRIGNKKVLQIGEVNGFMPNAFGKQKGREVSVGFCADISDKTEVVARYKTEKGYTRPVFAKPLKKKRKDGGLDFRLLDLGVPQGDEGSATRVSNNGHYVLGIRFHHRRVIYWVMNRERDKVTKSGLFPLLGSVEYDCSPFGVNDAGTAIGESGRMAVLFTPRETIDLNGLTTGLKEVVLIKAVDINNAGQILCLGENDNEYVPVLLTPRRGR